MRSTFQAWKSSCERVFSSAVWLAASEPVEVRMVLLRCSIPSPATQGR